MKKPEKKKTSNAIYKLFKLTGRDAASESNEVRPESLQPFQRPGFNLLTHPARRSTNRTFFLKTMISDYFLSERRISQPKTQ